VKNQSPSRPDRLPGKMRMCREERLARIRAVKGKYASVLTSSEAFAQRKREEIELEISYMRIYFATHATSKDNEAGVSSGWNDVGLSQLGTQQAGELGERFRNTRIDLICCSDLKRAVDTVKIAFADKIPVVVDKRLREINYGDLSGKPTEIVSPMKKEKIKEPFPNGESYEQAVARIQDFYRELKKDHPEKVVLVVGHRVTQYGLDILVGGKTIEECLNTPFKWQPYWEYELSVKS
jgi:broad specificity phosphatase PhoE